MFVKICGITNEEDALLAVALGADAIGFVFAPSTRQISAAVARDIARRLPAGILTVGVFRGEGRSRIVKQMHQAGLKVAQLHGAETVEDTRWVKERVPQIIKAFSAGSSELEHAERYGADALLIDAASPGSGKMFDWSLAENAPRDMRLIMAGGLNPGNVAAAIAKVRPWGVDVSSGVEQSPGHKDPVLMRAFISAARSVPDSAYRPSTAEPYDWRDDL